MTRSSPWRRATVRRTSGFSDLSLGAKLQNVVTLIYWLSFGQNGASWIWGASHGFAGKYRRTGRRRHRTNASPGSAPPGARRSRSALRDDRDRLRDILRAIDRILEGTLAGRSEFQNDVKLQVWVLYHLQIIGEVSRSLSEELRQSYPDPVWSNAVGLLNILVHHYFEIDEELVWRARSAFLSRSRRQSLRQNLWCGRVACSSQTNNASPQPASGHRQPGILR